MWNCESYILNFARHIVRSHSNETDVQKYMALSPKKKQNNFSFKIIFAYTDHVCVFNDLTCVEV